MQVIAIVLLCLLVGTSALFGGYVMYPTIAFGFLAWWCMSLQRRIAALEAQQPDAAPEPETQRVTKAATAPVALPESAPAERTVREAPVTAEPPTHEATVITEPEPVERFYPDQYFERDPSAFDRLLERCKSWITTGNVPVKLGVVLSVFGLAFLVKEAIDRSWLVMPIEFRLIGVAISGIAMLVVGWRLRDARAGYGLSLQGGGIAVIYLTVYAAYGIYSLIPAVPAFVLLVATTVIAGWLAVKQDSRALAVLGIIGGFMAPILASSGSGNHVVLFSYYAVLNIAIIGIAWQRAWRELNVLGFLFTFVIGSIWGYTGYSADEFATTEPFLIVFFFIYLFVPILFARNVAPNIRGFVDGTLVFGAPLVAFSLQSILVSDFEYGLAWSAGILTAIYACLAAYLLRRAPDYMRVLGEAFAGLAIVFLAITIPLTFEAQATSLAWALQGAAMCWLGWRQNRWLAMLAGVVLQGLAAGAWFVSGGPTRDMTAILNGPYLGAAAIALAAAVSSRIFDLEFQLRRQASAQIAAFCLLVWSALWWFGAGFSEIDRLVPWEYKIESYLVFAAGSVAAAVFVAQLAKWNRPAVLGLILVPVMVFGGMWAMAAGQPFAGFGWLAWIAVFAAHLFYLRRCERTAPIIAKILHPLGLITLVAILLAEVYWHADQMLPGIWPVSIGLIFVGSCIVGVACFGRRIQWPVAEHIIAYKWHATGFIAIVGTAYMLLANLLDDGSAGEWFSYIPVFNPLELASIALAACIYVYLRSLRDLESISEKANHVMQYVRPAAAGFGLFLLTMMTARCVHHYAGVPFDADRLMASEIFQASLSILWGASAFSGMIVGARHASRFVWLAGSGLMGIVVVKLFLVDLANTATVERVVSFLGVGILLLVVGYFAPAPPRSGGENALSDSSIS